MYNSTSINDGLQFINQSSTRINKTCNKYKNKNKKELILDNDDEIIENFVVDDTAITVKNINETNTMNTNIVGYNNSMNDLNSIQNSITKQSKIFLDINKKSDDSSLRNKDVQITNGTFGRVNNAGLFKPYPAGMTKCGIPKVPKSVGFDLSGKSAAEYSVLEDAAGNLALYGTDMVQGPSGAYPCSDYAGTNIYVSKPVDFNYDTNMVYIGVYDQNAANVATNAGQLTAQNDLGNSTVKQCVTRAMDKGMSFASLSNYNSNSKTGQCYVGNHLLNGGSSNAYRTIQRATIFTIPNTSHDAFTFAADGGLYSGTSGDSGNLFLSPLITATGSTKVPVGILSPKYGGTISYITASYAFEKGWGNWDDLIRFNSSIIGTPGGGLDTFKRYSYWYPIMKTYTNQSGDTYQQQDWEIRTHDSVVTWPSTGLIYIYYMCGNQSKEPIYREANLGEGFSIGCWKLYEQYPSFSLNLTDDGTITIVNNKTSNDILYISTNQISNQSETQIISIAGAIKTMMPWADRPDWVSGSVNGGGLLTSYSKGSKTLTNGQYISSPSGKCRLIFYKSGGNSGILVLEYSVYNVSQTEGTSTSQGLDKDNNLIGNSNNYSQYYLSKVDDPNIKGKIAYIDINNGLHEYPSGMTEFDNDYIEMKNFVPNPLNGTTISNTTEALCKTACNNDPLCAGYTYNSSVCKKYRDTEIYPKGDRILDDGKTTYIRKKKISTTNSTHFSCNKFVHNVDSGVYSSYPITEPNPMTTTQKCALGLILDPRMGVLETKNSAAVRKGDEIKGYINGIYTNQNNLKDTINTKSKDIEKGIAGQEAVKKQIDKYEESNITSTATVTDTELLLVSDNYQYVLWSIVTVLVGIAAIKTFRGAAE